MMETERSIVMSLGATHASGLTNFHYRTLLTPQPRSPHLLALLLGVGTGTRSVVRARLGRVLLPRQSLCLLSRPKILPRWLSCGLDGIRNQHLLELVTR